MTIHNHSTRTTAQRAAAFFLSGALPLAGLLAVGASTALLAGCEKKKKPVVVEAPPPPPPPAPERVAIDPILAELHPSAKLQFPADKAPHNEALARAIVTFADALAKGNADTFGGLLTANAKPLLDQLQADGMWDDSTAKIEALRVVYAEDAPAGPDAAAAAVYFAVQDPSGAYILGWGAVKLGDTWLFTGAPASNAVKRRASEWDSAGITGLLADDTQSIADLINAAPPADPAAPSGGGNSGGGSTPPSGDAPQSPDRGTPPANPRRPTIPTAPNPTGPG